MIQNKIFFLLYIHSKLKWIQFQVLSSGKNSYIPGNTYIYDVTTTSLVCLHKHLECYTRQYENMFIDRKKG